MLGLGAHLPSLDRLIAWDAFVAVSMLTEHVLDRLSLLRVLAVPLLLAHWSGVSGEFP